MVGCHPVTQTFHDHLLHYRVIAVQRISTAAEIVIVALRGQHIIYIVVEALKRNHRAMLIALSRMVKYDIQNNLHSVLMQRFDQSLEFFPLPVVFIGRRIAGVRGKKAYRIISPEVAEFFSANHPGILCLIKFKDRHQLYRCNPQIFQIGNLLHQPRKGSRILNSGRRMIRKAPHMHFIYDGFTHGKPGREHILPVKVISDNSGMVLILITALHSPDALAGYRFGIWVEKRLCLIKNQSF